ncbi:MAG: LptF/LptG family permease, partial [Candidatus Omnitrophica bacterium]|nr:LptF/LptG family permease [Candidatus Omnitrophota bacterium]
NFYKLNFRTYYMTLNVQEKPKDKKLAKKAREMTASEILRELKKPLKERMEPECLLGELHKKFSMSFSALMFVLIGVPLAIKTHRGEKSISLGISIGVLIIYWVLLAGGTAAAFEGKVAPWFAMWFPDMLIGLTGLILLYNSHRR